MEKNRGEESHLWLPPEKFNTLDTTNQGVERLYSKNLKTLSKAMEDDTKILKDIPGSGIVRIAIVQMTILPEGIKRLKGMTRKHPGCFSETKYKYSKCHRELHRIQPDKASQERINNEKEG